MEHRAEFLDPAVLEQLGGMKIRAQSLVVGILSGMHRSPHRGGAIEFAEYVEYTPGEEIRHIDWKVYGKSDKYYVKQFQDETNLRVYMVVDGSGSMDFQSEDAAISKLQFSSYLAAALSYLFMRQGDAVGMMSLHDEFKRFVPASSKTNHLDDLFSVLDGLPGTGVGTLAATLKEIAERAQPRSQVMIFSDMLEADEEALELLSVLRKRRYDVAVFHAIDPAELSFPYEGLIEFEGLEDEGTLLVDPDDLRQTYLKTIRAHLALVEETCENARIDYIRFTTNEAVEEVALRFLRRRK